MTISEYEIHGVEVAPVRKSPIVYCAECGLRPIFASEPLCRECNEMHVARALRRESEAKGVEQF